MKLKPSLRFCLVFALVLGATAPGCQGTDTPTTPGTSPTDAEVATASEAVTLLLEAVLPTTASSQSLALQSQAPEVGAPAGEFGLTCPEVTLPHAPGVGALVVQFDYGAGCVSQWSGQAHTGLVALTLSTGGYSVLFDGYSGDGYAIGGALAGTLEGSTLTIATTSFQLAGHGTEYLVTAALAGTWADGGTPTQFADDSWAVTGQATISEVGARAYAFDITQALQVTSGCPWPVSGRVTIQTGTNPVVTTVDFGSGDCDDLVTVTAAGKSKSVHLSTGKEA